MALETINFLSFLPSSKPPSRMRTIAIPSPYMLPSTISVRPSQSLSTTTKIFTTDQDDAINRVAYPSLANANLMYFKSGYYNVEVVPEDGESEEKLLNDFRRSVFRAGVLQETRRRRFFESTQEKKKRKTKEAAKKNRKRRPTNPKPKPHSTPDIHKHKKVFEEDDDNWELPPQEVEIPYTN